MKKESKNVLMTKAKTNKNDEFYTRIEYIQKELEGHLELDKDLFKNKIILLPCDNPKHSKFTKYFLDNFKELGLKRLISSCYIEDKNGLYIDIDKDNLCDFDIKELNEDGDFRSSEVTNFKDETDFIITNPPFSLFREFIDWIDPNSNRKFLILGNINASTYLNVFPHFMSNKLNIGLTSYNQGMYFNVNDEHRYNKTYKFKKEIDNDKVCRVTGIAWFTNIEMVKNQSILESLNSKEYNTENHNSERLYLDYKNYNGIEVPKNTLIPNDYYGIIGVPITYLNKHNPLEFEILGMTDNKDAYGLKTKIYTKEESKEEFFKKNNKKGNSNLNGSAVLEINGLIYSLYDRILIKRIQK